MLSASIRLHVCDIIFVTPKEKSNSGFTYKGRIDSIFALVYSPQYSKSTDSTSPSNFSRYDHDEASKCRVVVNRVVNSTKLYRF